MRTRFALGFFAGALALGAAAVPLFAADNETASVPQFTGVWVRTGEPMFDAVKGAPGGPVERFQVDSKDASEIMAGDCTNPILQPWAREELRKANEKSLSGRYVAIPKERCLPVGVPAFDVLPATPVYFLQTPKEVTLIWAQNYQARHVYMNVPHSQKVAPTWYGESVGHYEGDALVVDTIGLSTKTYVDNYFTPHTEQLHVVERFRMIDGGKTLEVNVHVEDPGAFTTPWNAIQRYRRMDNGPMQETVCLENNDDHFNQGFEPIPTANKPDF